MQDSSGSRALARCAQGAARHDPPRQQGPSDIAGHPVALHFTGRRRAPFWRRPTSRVGQDLTIGCARARGHSSRQFSLPARAHSTRNLRICKTLLSASSW
jgi:hypothetical protein